MSFYYRKKFLRLITEIQLDKFFTSGRDDGDSFQKDSHRWDALVRIAIIDTGFDATDPDVKNLIVGSSEIDILKPDRRPGIVGWHDFVAEQKSFVDKSRDRHGTLMAYLFLKTMPKAKVFIARVMQESSTYEDDAAAKVAKAVKHAVNVWRADIISISIGINTDRVAQNKTVEDSVALLKQEIDDASKNHLIFAAAGNNQLDVAWPARMTNVVTVYSYNSSGKDSSFSPRPQPKNPNFAVSGEDLEGLTAGDGRKVVHGTSCATPIAAAIGALVLDFVGCNADKFRRTTERSSAHKMRGKQHAKVPAIVSRENWFRQPEVMKHIFWQYMVDESRNLGQYNALRPELLFDHRSPQWVARAVEKLNETLEKAAISKLVQPLN